MLAASAALLLGGCGDGGDGGAAQTFNQGIGASLGEPIRRATCADWNRADPRARLDAIAALRVIRNQQVSGGSGEVRGVGSVLPDELAYDLFESRCGLPNADSFVLYKLYGFAAGFAGGAP
jgi:hypothetical protein